MSDVQAHLGEAMEAYRSSNPQSAAAFEAACHYLPGGGTRSSLAVDPFPLYISHGDGAKLTDLDGHEYIDFVSDFTSGLYGKTDAGLHDEIRSTLARGIQLGAHTTRERDLAELLCTRFPSINAVRFTNSGTEATLLALMTAVRYTGRNKVLVFDGGYHGTGFSGFHADEDGILGADQLQSLPSLRTPFDFQVAQYNDLQSAKAKIDRHGDDIAAILVEPMLGAGGCIPGSRDFLAGLRELASSNGSILIFDEIQTARLHYSGRQGQLNIIPDMTILGKFFGGGFAFGAFGGSKEIMAMYDWRCPGAAGHSGTFNNSILTMAAGAYATTKLLTRQALDDLTERGDQLRDRIASTFQTSNAPFRITGLGSINQIHCTLKGDEASAGLKLLYFELLARGYWIAQRGLLALSFQITDKDIDGFVEAMRQSVSGFNVET